MRHRPTVRHILPGLGILPRSLERDSTSGLVGSAVGFSRSVAAYTEYVELWGLANPQAGPVRYQLGGVTLCGVHPLPLGRFRGIDLRYQMAILGRILRSRPAGILHAHNLPTLLALPKHRIRVLHLHMALGEANPVERWLLSQAQAVVCASGYLESSFRMHYPDYRGTVRVIRNGVDPRLYADPRAGAALRSSLGIPPDRIVVLYSGQVSPLKGIDQLIIAIERLPAQSRPLLLIAGSSTLWRSVDTARSDAISAFERDLRERSRGLPVMWLGRLPASDVPQAILAADIVCCPSVVDEGLGTINLEAAAAGKPVVATRSGGVPEIVVNGETGILVSKADPDALAGALRYLSEDSALRQRFGFAARQRVFTWGEVGQELHELYDELLGRV
ncbi:MAG: glycosyltransferase family 4 protein [Chloroflexi bacterium]|nr:glycosyltransferase family 4 protein [Chloroflexota bacterium]